MASRTMDFEQCLNREDIINRIDIRISIGMK